MVQVLSTVITQLPAGTFVELSGDGPGTGPAFTYVGVPDEVPVPWVWPSLALASMGIVWEVNQQMKIIFLSFLSLSLSSG